MTLSISSQIANPLNREGRVLWFTGLPGSGKTTLSIQVEKKLFGNGVFAYTLDGDQTRKGLSSDLGFSLADRTENTRRISEVAKLFADARLWVMVAVISPLRANRDRARSLVKPNQFVEIFLDCTLEVCEKRDPKGLYKQARLNVIKDFTGISSPYEPPENPEIHLHTDQLNVEECVQIIMDYLKCDGGDLSE
jgi:adenylyl-sulfate kinase